MLFWSIQLLVVTGVLGQRDYASFKYNFQYGYGDKLCPELHVHMPDMHPHQCVSYAIICRGVKEVQVQIATNGTQYLCHNKFQPWGSGYPTIDHQDFNCGNATLIIQYDDELPTYIYCSTYGACLISIDQKCAVCQDPFYGEFCFQRWLGYDYYFKPSRKCANPGCSECDENSKTCKKCHQGYAMGQNQDCSIFCQGFAECDSNGTPITAQYGCKGDFYTVINNEKCSPCTNNCQYCMASKYNNENCNQCLMDYVLQPSITEPEHIVSCYEFKYCPYDQIQVISSYIQNNRLAYNMVCKKCELGFTFDQQQKKCVLNREIIQNCLFINRSKNTCKACLPWYALQQDGSCLPISCDTTCQTCLDTNPSYCTSCDNTQGRVLYQDTGICDCKLNHGLKDDICTLCTDGYCNECLKEDYFICTSCKPGSNRVLIDNVCVCQLDTYDPLEVDQICLHCDYTCVTCLGPSNQDCTQCEDESISNRNNMGNSCPCKDGYADYEIKQMKCGKCHPKCQSCFQAADETTNQYCLTCIQGQNRSVSNNFSCNCQENYGDYNGTKDICFSTFTIQCIVCDYTCGTCDDFGPKNCIQCLESSNRYLTDQRQCLCKTSYYDDETNNIDCQRCHYSCLLCANTSQQDACLECPQTRKPGQSSNTQFECICSSSHYFDDGFSPTCQECNYTCQTCNGPLISNCLTCNPNYRQLDLSSCVCRIGYYDIGQLECEKCHYSCYQCFDNTKEGCIVCTQELHLRLLKGNICKCLDGYYEEPDIPLCKKCSYKCETCENQPEKCLSCPLNSLRIFDSVKGCFCPGESYDKEGEITCQKCYFKCKTCSGSDEESCLSCDSVANRELTMNQCKCKPHYFEMEVQECTICSAFCYECINNYENCISCNDDRYLFGSTCKCITKFEGASISTFNFNGNVKCQKCHHSCGTCGGVEEGDCISCIDSDYRYQVGNTCVCNDGYFDAGLPVCLKCSYKCKRCTKQSENCSSCQDNSFRQFISGFNKCQCVTRYYDDGQNEVCKKCHYSCLRCNEIDTKCELCSSDSNRIYNDKLFSCDCDIGYYDTGIEICSKCHYSCLRCNFGEANSCMSCPDLNTSNRVFYNNSCKCLFGYFDDGQSILCQKCEIQCLSCYGQSQSCLSCPQTRIISSNCKCQQGYYEVGLQLCSKCDSNCMTCEFTSNNCTSCYTDQFRELNLTTQTCDCQIGYLELNGICEECNLDCKTCSQSINKCTSCVKLRYLKDNDCLCNDGMYEQSSDNQCKLCNKTCLTCAYSNNYCLTCSIENFRTFKSGNLCECIQGYYENPITQNCEQCAASCLTCSILYDNCLTCDTSFNLSLVNNKCVCSQSYYFDSLTKQCQQCNITCFECINSNECTSCKFGTRHLDQNQTKCLCNDGYFETNQQNCSLCHFSCETCENVSTYCLTCMNQYQRILSNNNCLCIDGYYEAGIEMCQKCNTICKLCSSTASNCLSCYETDQFRFLSGRQCLCKPGYFEQNTDMCKKCSNECLTCQGQADYCTSCDTNSKRIDQSIIHKCPCLFGFYEDQNKICQKCNIKCQTCINQNDQCLSCKIELNSNRKSLSDECNCKEGYFDDGIQVQCQPCNFKCKTCVNKMDNCQICQNQIRINPPICNCMDGYFEDEQFTCQICSPQCNTCALEPSNCLTCKPGRIGYDCKCIDGYIEIGSIFCQQCAFQCATCEIDFLNCKTCKGNRAQEPQCICQSGYFDDQFNEDCQLCDSTCLECNIIGCLSCQANRILNEEMDCIPPPNSIWYDNTPWCSTCQVAVVKTFLSDDISKIIIRFDFPLNQKGFNSQFEFNKCLQLFELESALSFGQNSICYVNKDNDKELLISLGEYSKIVIGQEILFKSNSLSHINCETTLKKFIFTTLQMPINPLPPQIEYLIPLHKLNPFADNSVYLKSIKNNGNRKLDNIVWSCQVETSQDSSALSQFLDQLNFLQEYNLFIPKLTLPSDTELKFKIQYENFIQINSYSELTIRTHTGALPQIYLNIKPSYLVYETIQMVVSVGNLEQSIYQDNTKYQIQLFEIDRSPRKSAFSQLNISVQTYSFEQIQAKIQKYTLSPNSTYTFQVIATNLNTQKAQNENFTIDIPFAGLICQYNNRGIQSIRKDLNLKIECRDLDTSYEWNNDPDLLIQVDCKDLSLNSTCQNGQKQIIKVNKTDNFQFIKKNQISPFTVQEWTVNVTKFQQTSKFVLIIVYLDEDFPALDLEYNQGYLMRKINNYEQLNFTFLIGQEQKVHLLDLSIAIIYNYELIAIIQPKYKSHQFKIFNSIEELNFGDSINLKFAAQFTNNIMPSQNNIKITINQPPYCPKLFITRSSDLALTDLIVATKCEQSNDSPYKYQLRLFLRENDLTGFLQGKFDNSLSFYPFQNQNYFSIQIPTSVDLSTIGVLIQVLDSGGSITNVFERITSKPAKINCSSISYQNMILQNKISLLFESMNQNCEKLHQQIYLNLFQEQILPDQNDNTLKFQAIKLYKIFVNQLVSDKPQNRLLNEETPHMCYDLNTTHFSSTQPHMETNYNLTNQIDDFKKSTLKLNTALKYFSQMKKQSLEEITRNQYIWNEEIFQQYQNSQDSLINLIYYIDDIYSNLSTIDIKNESIYQSVVSLLKFIPLIVEETQNIIHVNDKPIVIQGDEIIWQIKRRTKQFFNEQFNIEKSQEDYLVEFLQYESIYLKSNPFRFASDLEILLQKEFNDQTLKLYSENYYQIKLKNAYNSRFVTLEVFPSKYSTKFGTYQTCTNSTQILERYEMQCVIRTFSGKLHKCNLNILQNNDTFEQTCECHKFGEIFLTLSTNFSQVIVNSIHKQLELDNTFESNDFWVLMIATSSLTFIFMALYIFNLFKEYKNQQVRIEPEQKNLNPQVFQAQNSLIYKGNSLIFKQQFKNIHQTISLLYYRDKSIQLSYRILDVLSQFNLLLTLAIVECWFKDNQIIFISLFIIANPIAIFILRTILKIFEAIYRFGRISAVIIQLILIILLMAPNLILCIFYSFKISIQSEQYVVGIIFLGNVLLSQLLLETFQIFARIIIYRQIAASLKNLELNPIYHFMHFFVIHSSLEEIFEEFTKI